MRKLKKKKKKDQGPAQFHLSEEREANRERAWGTWESGHSMKEKKSRINSWFFKALSIAWSGPEFDFPYQVQREPAS